MSFTVNVKNNALFYFSYFGTAMAPVWRSLYNESVETFIETAHGTYTGNKKVSLEIFSHPILSLWRHTIGTD